MKKSFQLLGTFVIVSSTVPSTIAAAPHQPQAQQNKAISEYHSDTNLESLNDINAQNVNNESYFINSTAQEIKNFKNKDQSFSFVKKIKDIFGNELYYIQYQESSAIVSIKHYETLEISNNLYDEGKFSSEIIYLPSVGMVYKENNQLYSIDNKLIIQDEVLSNILLRKNNYNYFLESNKIENKKARDINFEKHNKEIKIRKKRASYKSATESSEYANNIRVSNEVPHSWWFRLLDSYNTLGYTETPNGNGLCEYIALSMLILYQELFVSSGYLTDNEIRQYFWLPKNLSRNIKNGLLQYKYYQGKQPEKSFIRKLWNLNNQATDIKTGRTISNIVKQFLKNKPIDGRYEEDWSTSWLHKSSPEDLLLSKRIPVMLSFVYGLNGHNIIIYGYDKPNKKFLVNYGWSGSQNSQRLLSKSLVWSYFSAGYWHALSHKSNAGKLPLKPLFTYKGRSRRIRYGFVSTEYTSEALITQGIVN